MTGFRAAVFLVALGVTIGCADEPVAPVLEPPGDTDSEPVDDPDSATSVRSDGATDSELGDDVAADVIGDVLLDAHVDVQPDLPVDGEVADAGGTDDAGRPQDPQATAFLASVSRNLLDSFASGTQPVVWSESANLEALALVFDGTGDTRILDEMLVHIDAIVAGRSSERGQEDELRGTVIPAWPTDGYECGTYYAHAVHTGVLTYPMAWFAQTVLESTELDAEYGIKARELVDVVEAALAVHADQFANTGDAGRYRWPSQIGRIGVCDGTDYASRAGTPLPFNMMLAMGRSHLALGRALERLDDSRAAGHLDRALRLARFFEDYLDTVAASDGYSWLYSVGGRPEDTAHASLDVRFVAQAWLEGLHFSAAQMDRFVNTYLRYLTADPHLVRSHLEADYGNGAYERRWQQGAARWLDLAVASRDVYDRGRYIHFNAEGDSILSRAQVIRWRPDGAEYPSHVTPHAGLPLFRPWGSTGPSSWTGLYRPSDTPLVDVAGVSVSSCAHWTFETERSLPLSARYRHTAAEIAGDSCSGASCGSAAGFVVFHSVDGATWRRVSFPEPLAEQWRVETVTIDEPFRHVLGCRSGAGHARNNLQVSWVRTEGP